MKNLLPFEILTISIVIAIVPFCFAYLPNSLSCNRFGICKCDPDRFLMEDGHCVRKKMYGESCSHHGECYSDLNLICENSTCSCNSTEAVYDLQYNMCVGKRGTSCKKYSRCVKNANFLGCGRGTFDICKCDDQPDHNKNDLCLGKYNTSCNTLSSPCQDDFHCRNGRCICHFPQFQFYDEKKGKCVSRVGGPCLETIQGKVFQYECTGQSECQPYKGTGTLIEVHECICKTGHIKSGDECKHQQGTSCEKDDDCDSGLTCTESICSCPDFRIYNSRVNKCMGLFGAICESSEDCVDNAYCVLERHNQTRGICRCYEQTTLQPNRQCIPKPIENDSGKSLPRL